EVAQLDQAGEVRVVAFEVAQRVVEGEELGGLLLDGRVVVQQRQVQRPPAPPGGLPAPGVVDEDLAHGAACQSEKMLSIPPRDLRRVHQLQKSLVDERGGGQRVVG